MKGTSISMAGKRQRVALEYACSRAQDCLHPRFSGEVDGYFTIFTVNR